MARCANKHTRLTLKRIRSAFCLCGSAENTENRRSAAAHACADGTVSEHFLPKRCCTCFLGGNCFKFIIKHARERKFYFSVKLALCALFKLPAKFKAASGKPLANAALFTLDTSTKKTVAVKRFDF